MQPALSKRFENKNNMPKGLYFKRVVHWLLPSVITSTTTGRQWTVNPFKAIQPCERQLNMTNIILIYSAEIKIQSLQSMHLNGGLGEFASIEMHHLSDDGDDK